MRAFDEIIDFIASGTTPKGVVEFRPSEETCRRLEWLLAREKAGQLAPEEKVELGDFLTLEHIMRLAKARARRRLAS